ncbi:cell adhesion molecule Dscam2 isoform X3 [Chironomus tepperi]|uniref:cell adhesion molecule Dscam2 isoform X3 n=1 Tax=Chironomus tepperi TaxID=113505 RepID=UPI00391F1D59
MRYFVGDTRIINERLAAFFTLQITWLLVGFTNGYTEHDRGPSFVMEPPSKLEFSNSSGGFLDCSASGNPQPTIDWLSIDGTSIGDVGGIRKILRNGTLVLQQFPAAAYRQDIHNTVYRCVASNRVGRIISRDVQIRAVVAQSYKVEVETLAAPRGCTAILRCVIPTFVKEYVRVVSWVQEPAFFIYPSLQGDGKYHLLPNGDLLIHNLEHNDRFASYRCRTMHKLTRLVVISNPSKISINDHRGIVSPSIVEYTSSVTVSQDEGAVLMCVAQGCPSVEYRWYSNIGAEPLPLLPGPRVRLMGPILAIEAVTTEDAGTYKCIASNTGGEASTELKLVVTTSIQVEVSPNVISVNMGQPNEFTCLVTSNGIPIQTQQISWFKDGRQLTTIGRNENILRISAVGREDKGMYQCIVRRKEGDTFQASAELLLGDAPPVLLYSFIEQTLQPGPAVSLKCSATGNPTPEVSWKLDGFPLPSNGRFLIGQYVTAHGDVISHVNITHVMIEDGGEYSCIIENRAGKLVHSARLNVYGLPYIRLIPKVIISEGKQLTIKCPVAGYPIEEIHWEKGGRELPEDIRQKVDGDGTLTIYPVQKNEDSGVYTCWAKNKQGLSARRSGEVKVIVPPKLNPFHSPILSLNVGDRASIPCSVVKGDLPISLKWLKNKNAIDPGLGITITQVDHYNSILVIEHLTASHSANYSCVVSNPAASMESTQMLLVNVPPKWKLEPIDTSVERNKHVLLHCQADGVPTPTVIWKKALGSKSSEYEEMQEKLYTKIFPNGTLLLQNVKEDREGFYMCQANNGIGNGLGKVIQLKVNSPPYFVAPSKIVNVKKGDTAILHCEVNGDKPINVIWLLRGKYELNPSSNYRVSIKQDTTPEGILAEIQIMNVESSDNGQYFCQASNLYGRDQQLVQLLVQEPPQSPSSLETTIVSSRSVNLRWHPRDIDATEITKYIVEYCCESDQQWKYLDISDPPQYNALIENLKPATKYIFRVIAEGPTGRSAPSQELTVKTEPQRPNAPPINLSARPVSSTEILVTWSPPLYEFRNGEIQGFNIGYKIASLQSVSYNFTSVSGDGEDGTGEIILSNLMKYTRYSIVAQAFNQIGVGPLSEPVSTQTMEDVPSSSPEDIRCAPLTSTSLQVSWQPPHENYQNGLLQGYKINFEPIVDYTVFDNEEPDVKKTTALTTVLTSLRKFTNYSIQILAYTRMGDGVLSAPKFCHTEEDVPEAPNDIKVVVSSSTSLYVSWLTPQFTNGVIIKYNLYTRQVNGREELNNDKKSIGSQQTYYEAMNLMPHVEYQFWVSASTRVGEGKSSKVVSLSTSNRVPAKIISFGISIIKPWKSTVQFACMATGQPRREWFKNDNSINSFFNGQVLENGELSLYNIQSSDSGNYTCQVDNGIGVDKIVYNLIVQLPPSQPMLYVTSATSTSILMHWKNSGNGNAKITSYTLHYKRFNGNVDEINLSKHATSFELKNLVCGSTYNIYLIAQNKIGSSPPSTTLHVKTQGQAPGIPLPVQLITPNSTSVVLHLQAWPHNGCNIQYFTVQYRPLSTDSDRDRWTLVSNALKPHRRFIISNLQPSTLYQLKVEAHNSAGSTTADFSFVTLTINGDTPSIDLDYKNSKTRIFYYDVRFITLGIVLITILICTIAIMIICLKCRQRRIQKKNSIETSTKSSEIKRDRFYGTIHKTPLQISDKIPESSEDISPYATFQLAESNAMIQSHPGAANTLLHSFMYHERAMTEGCASPNPAPMLRKLQSPYYNINPQNKQRFSKKNHESEESDSDDLDQLTSSRTDTSNQMDAKAKHVIPPNAIYHGQSSTSSDLSPPMSDQHQKSLSRCIKSRYHQHFHNLNLNTTPRHKSDSTNSSLTTSRTINLQDETSDRILSSQFRPIHTTSSRTINLSKANLN